ncbi:hypothetical protein [Nocardia jiangsuensis]|uniref:Uncharacterized protein n=1 Tax=Nocardia jiangsuensis TaxID=1691563 RepID=A0ABV8DY07_9NOCA
MAALLTTPAAGYLTGAPSVVDGGMPRSGPQVSARLTDEKRRTP